MSEKRHKIVICMGSSCFARGNAENLNRIEVFLAQNSLSAQIELVGCGCARRCSEGPNIEIDGESFHQMDKEALLDLLNQKLKGEKA